MRYDEILTELKIHGEFDEGSSFVMDNRGNVTFYNYFDDIPEEIVDGVREMDDEYANYLIGDISNNAATLLYVDETSINSILSSNLKKLVKHLNLDGVYYVTYNDDELFIGAHSLLTSKLSNVTVYHGTNSDYLNAIFKTGIRPVETSNFGNIKHDGMIFVTTKIEIAKFHAFNQAMSRGSIPVVIATTIPDPDKIVLDYDVAIQKYGVDHPLTQKLGYDMVYRSTGGKYGKKYTGNTIADISDKNSINMKIGIFGYKGRIPASKFTAIYTDAEAIYLNEIGDAEYVYAEENIHYTRYSSKAEFIKDYEHYDSLYRAEIEDDDEDEDY